MALNRENQPSEDLWGTLKGEIHCLYLEDKLTLEGSGGVMEVMAERHNFKATSEANYRKPESGG